MRDAFAGATYSLPFVDDKHGCSREGAEKALPKAGTQLAEVLSIIRMHGPVSDHDIRYLSGPTEQTRYALSVVVARRNELVKRGQVESAGTHVGPAGVRNTRWQVVGG